MKILDDYLQEASRHVSFQMLVGNIPFSKSGAEAQYMEVFKFAPQSIQEQGRKIIHNWIYEVERESPHFNEGSIHGENLGEM